MSIGPTHHAVESFRRFYPVSDRDALVVAFTAGDEVEPEIAMRLTGRKGEPRSHNVYRLHVERTGLFVFDPRSETIVTFLRFYGTDQRELAIRLFGERERSTARHTWIIREETEPEPPAPKVGNRRIQCLPRPDNREGPLVHLGAPWSYVEISPAALEAMGGSRESAKRRLFDYRPRPLKGSKSVAVVNGTSGELLSIERNGPGRLSIVVADE